MTHAQHITLQSDIAERKEQIRRQKEHKLVNRFKTVENNKRLYATRKAPNPNAWKRDALIVAALLGIGVIIAMSI